MATNKKNDNTLIAAIITAIVAIVISYYTGYQNRQLEIQQYESNLILKAIETKNIDSCKNNLRFLIQSGLISKENEKIKRLLDNDTILQLKFAKNIVLNVEPNNSFYINSPLVQEHYQLWEGQILDEENRPIDSVQLKTYKQHKFINDTTYFSFTYSDTNGFFRLPIPNSLNTVKLSLTKKGYKPITQISTPNQLKRKNIFILKNK